MNPTTSAANLAYTPGRINTQASIQEIDNGYVLNWYDTKPHNVFCASLDEVRSKLESDVFTK
jgi:hypothetical protein